MNPVSCLQFIALSATAAALVSLIVRRPGGLEGDLRTPLLLLTSLAFIKYAVNGVEWLGLDLPIDLDHLEDYLDSLWPATWFILFFSTRLSLGKRDLQAAHEQLERTLVQLQETQQLAARDERLKALGRMTSGIAHDFNNNLQPILGYAELLLEAPDLLDDPAERVASLTTMHRAAANAAETVRRLQSFYSVRGAASDLEPVDPSDIARQAVDSTRHAWKHQALARSADINVILDLGFEGRIRANPSRFSDVLINLILNAVDALPRGGTIRVGTRSDGDRMVLEIEDDGIGMTPEVLDHCLDPFFTTKDQESKGAGLGLSLAYGILRGMGAELSIRSRVDQGTTITITAPVEASKALAPPAPAAAPSHARRILLIDDDDAVRRVVHTLLSSAGHQVAACASAAEGCARFRAEPFDLVITDLAMPRESGLDVARNLKAMHPTIPIILLTGYGALMAAKGECPTWVDALVSKPVHRARLCETIDRLAAS